MLSRLHISTDRHYLVQDDGHPLFWLADTAWDLFDRLTLAEAEEYLTARHDQEFTAIMAVVLAENADLANLNELGMMALHESDPLRPNAEY